MRKAIVAAMLALTSVGAMAGNQIAQHQTPRVINVTTDSAPGWLPSEALEAEADKMLKSYFRTFDMGNDRGLWELTDEGFKTITTFAAFQAGNIKTRANLGRLKKLDVLKVTWTKDPAEAPRPGIYVAIDFAGQFTRAKRQCGYVVLFKATENDPFHLGRIENTYLTDAVAKQIAKGKSPAEVDRVWSLAAANCPNYQLPQRTKR